MSRRRGPRQIVFVCSSAKDSQVISKIVQAETSEDALKLFEDEFQIKAQIVQGPFYKKKVGVLNTTRNVQFANKSKKAIYNDWIVNALLLKEPENSAFLLFEKRVDGKQMSKPKGTFIVKIDDLRILE